MLQLPETPFAAENKANSRVSSETPDKLKEEGALCGLPRALERKEAGEKQAPLTDTQKFEKKHGVTVETRGDKHVYILKVNGQDKELLTTDANAKGIEKAEAELVKLRNEKMAELTKTFKVTFALEGEDVIKQWIQKDDCSGNAAE